jgi:hypothetical protein
MDRDNAVVTARGITSDDNLLVIGVGWFLDDLHVRYINFGLKRPCTSNGGETFQTRFSFFTGRENRSLQPLQRRSYETVPNEKDHVSPPINNAGVRANRIGLWKEGDAHDTFSRYARRDQSGKI